MQVTGQGDEGDMWYVIRGAHTRPQELRPGNYSEGSQGISPWLRAELGL